MWLCLPSSPSPRSQALCSGTRSTQLRGSPGSGVESGLGAVAAGGRGEAGGLLSAQIPGL